MSGAKISFLITKMKPKPEQDDVVKQPSTPAPKGTIALPAGVASVGTPSSSTPQSTNITGNADDQVLGAQQFSTPKTPLPYVPPPRIEDFDEKNDITEIEFYQPVTVLLLTDNNDIRQALLRAIRPPDMVEKYMDEVFDKCKRAGETYLAFRLPRDVDVEMVEKRVKSRDGTPAVATPIIEGSGGLGLTLGGLEKKKAGRPRKSLV